MPNLLKTIPETMRKQGFSEEVISQIAAGDEYSSEAVMALIDRMDRLLTKEQRLSIMQEQGCCKTGAGPKAHGEFGKSVAGKPLAEKIALMGELKTVHKAPCRINDDGTLTVYWGSEDLDSRSCPCGVIKKLPESFTVPITFCGCCGGHIKNNYQKSLGVKLRLKEVVSSSSSSNGKKRCEFLYDVIE